jgi:hypothetical protein
MYRVVILSGKPYAMKIDEVEDDLENIEGFVAEGSVVILCDDLVELEPLGIDPASVEIVD